MVNKTSRIPAGFTLVEEDDEVEEKETTTEVEETKGHPYTTWSGETKYHKKIKVPEAHRPKLRKPPIETPPVEEKVPPKGSGATNSPTNCENVKGLPATSPIAAGAILGRGSEGSIGRPIPPEAIIIIFLF